MTNEEAINTLSVLYERHKQYRGEECIRYLLDGDYVNALDMGIQALEERQTGHWIDNTDLGYHVSICSICNWRGHGDTRLIYKSKYCPNCGAKMVVEPQESDHKCRTCKHYTSGENDGSCGSYICKGYSNWESEEQA